MSQSELAFPALTAALYEGFEKHRGRQLSRLLGAQLIESIDYALVHSKAPVEYLEALLAAATDFAAATLILSVARYGHRNEVPPEYVAAVFMLPFKVEGRDEDQRVENRVAAFHSAGVPAEYATALRHTGLTVAEVVGYWQDGLSAEYVTASL
jgi:hypothetical protein